LKIDLNSDLGESFGAYCMGNDSSVLENLSSANVACGFHAGDPLVMERTVQQAAEKGVAVGAHPGFPDLLGFGRREMACKPDEVYAYCLYQIGALAAICRSKGISLQHVKAHGALYNMAARDPVLAEAIAFATRDAAPDLILMGLANSIFSEAAVRAGVIFAAEAFADRAYRNDGSLLPRSEKGAVIHDPEEASRRVIRMVTTGSVTSIDGTEISIYPDSICLHGDTPEAVQMSFVIREKLLEAGIGICDLREILSGRHKSCSSL